MPYSIYEIDEQGVLRFPKHVYCGVHWQYINVFHESQEPLEV